MFVWYDEQMRTKILYEDRDVLVIHKPAGLATHTARVGQMDVVSELKNYLAAENRRRGTAGGPPFLGVVHRLDQPVEGTLVFGKTRHATAQLTEQLKKGILNKHYYAVVCGKPEEKQGRVVDYLVKGDNGMARVVGEDYPGAKRAISDYELLDCKQLEIGAWQEVASRGRQVDVSLVRVHILTGRYHQIRMQMSHMGSPILGDQKYASGLSQKISESLQIQNVALCAYHLHFLHPFSEKKMEYTVCPENRAFTLFQDYFAENGLY